jgi:hypothetical protein
MSPEAVRILARLGVVEILERAGAFPLEGMKVTGPRGATAHGKFALAGHRPFRPTGSLFRVESSTTNCWPLLAAPAPRFWSEPASKNCCMSGAAWPEPWSATTPGNGTLYRPGLRWGPTASGQSWRDGSGAATTANPAGWLS